MTRVDLLDFMSPAISHVAFNSYASEYDSWYDGQTGRVLFAMEIACLQPLLHRHKRPYLEIGVGAMIP